MLRVALTLTLWKILPQSVHRSHYLQQSHACHHQQVSPEIILEIKISLIKYYMTKNVWHFYKKLWSKNLMVRVLKNSECFSHLSDWWNGTNEFSFKNRRYRQFGLPMRSSKHPSLQYVTIRPTELEPFFWFWPTFWQISGHHYKPMLSNWDLSSQHSQWHLWSSHTRRTFLSHPQK